MPNVIDEGVPVSTEVTALHEEDLKKVDHDNSCVVHEDLGRRLGVFRWPNQLSDVLWRDITSRYIRRSCDRLDRREDLNLAPHAFKRPWRQVNRMGPKKLERKQD